MIEQETTVFTFQRLNQRIDSREEAGFTLIELAIVIAVIALLIAVALPTFLGVQKNAHRSAAVQLLANSMVSAKSFYGTNGSSYNNLDMSKLEPSATYMPTNTQLAAGTTPVATETGVGKVAYSVPDTQSVSMTTYDPGADACINVVDYYPGSPFASLGNGFPKLGDTIWSVTPTVSPQTCQPLSPQSQDVYLTGSDTTVSGNGSGSGSNNSGNSSGSGSGGSGSTGSPVNWYPNPPSSNTISNQGNNSGGGSGSTGAPGSGMVNDPATSGTPLAMQQVLTILRTTSESNSDATVTGTALYNLIASITNPGGQPLISVPYFVVSPRYIGILGNAQTWIGMGMVDPRSNLCINLASGVDGGMQGVPGFPTNVPVFWNISPINTEDGGCTATSNANPDTYTSASLSPNTPGYQNLWSPIPPENLPADPSTQWGSGTVTPVTQLLQNTIDLVNNNKQYIDTSGDVNSEDVIQPSPLATAIRQQSSDDGDRISYLNPAITAVVSDDSMWVIGDTDIAGATVEDPNTQMCVSAFYMDSTVASSEGVSPGIVWNVTPASHNYNDVCYFMAYHNDGSDTIVNQPQTPSTANANTWSTQPPEL